VVLEVKLRSYSAHWHIALFLTTWRVHELKSLIQGLRLRLVRFALTRHSIVLTSRLVIRIRSLMTCDSSPVARSAQDSIPIPG
jgi:hypothetical protein